MVWRWIWNIFHGWDSIFDIFESASVREYFFKKFYLPIEREKHCLVYLLHVHFLWFLNMFLSHLGHYVQYIMWPYNLLVIFIFWKKNHFWYFQCGNNNLCKYHFYSTDKSLKFPVKNVMKIWHRHISNYSKNSHWSFNNK